MDKIFVETENDIYQNVINFPQSSDEIRILLGDNPKYFLYTEIDKKYYFAVSKFSAFKNNTFSIYRDNLYYCNNGKTTRELISKVLNREWKAGRNLDKEIIEQFKQWIKDNTNLKSVLNNIDEIHFLEVNAQEELIKPKHIVTSFDGKSYKRKISKHDFSKLLEKRALIGNIGEEIAYQYEKQRNPNAKIKRCYLDDVGAGYDLYSKSEDGERFIEVKSNLISKNNVFYLSKNEWDVLESKGDNAFIYLIRLTDLENKQGEIEEIQNPISYIKSINYTKEITYKVKIK
ncbi:DUF3883 domain-containing protein [Actinobacillus genomosp. 2]|uniref:DUF3883 domain-containing protein n=1 Tax=Actinobacillus TaxID=713 RepID=UPI002441EA8A|nr:MULTISPECIES: DUF3883 domain-containing protein [Actinobacillus]WGE31538.1 DUF3883 domain-containing protein [Actinobacillus genomosp. 2]WGE91122.1 DUF3883 domain-containing protein [Actinobacillus genomosp. 1]